MKTTIKLLTIAFALGLFASCSSSLHVNSSAPTNSDGIYYYADGNSAGTPTPEGVSNKVLDMETLEAKYKGFLANDSSEGSDTVLFSSPNQNPYDRLLVDSYQEAYERRIAAMFNPYYRMNNWDVKYSSDYWYASAFDPTFYNVFTVGDSVWVEPTWITNMFGRSYYSNPWLNRYNDPDFIYFGFGFGSPFYYSHSLYMGPALYSKFRDDYEYGRRPGSGIVDYNSREEASASIGSIKGNLATRQITLGGQASIQDPVKKGTVSSNRGVVSEPVRDKNNNIVSPGSMNSPRSVGSKSVEGNTRVSVHRPPASYTRPNPGNKIEFNASKGAGKVNSSSGITSGNRGYNPPIRTSLPSVSVSNSSGSVSSSGRGSVSTSGGSHSVSGSSSISSGGRGSSGSSSSSSSSSSSTSSSSSVDRGTR